MENDRKRSVKNEQLSLIFEDEDKCSHLAENILSKILLGVLARTNVRLKDWNQLVDDYNRSPLSKSNKSSKDISQERNNFNRATFNFRTTWANFWKAIQILLPMEIEVDFKLRWKPDLWTIHRFNSKNRLYKLAAPGKFSPGDNLTREDLSDEERALSDERFKAE